MLQSVFKPQKFTGFHMGLIMVLFFGTIITVNLTLAWFANSSWTGLVVKNSYVASQHFDEETARLKAQQALGWKVSSDYVDGLFGIQLADREGNPIIADMVSAKIGRPATEVDDHVITLTTATGGRFSGATELAGGIWQADLVVHYGDGEIWNRSVRFKVVD